MSVKVMTRNDIFELNISKEDVLEYLRDIVRTFFVAGDGKELVLTTYQEKFVREILKREKRKYVFVASTRSGKTEATAVAATLVALFYSYEQIIIVAPTYRQSVLLYERIRGYLERNKYLFDYVAQDGLKLEDIRFKNESRIRIVSAGSVEGLLGYGATFLIIDEAGSIPEDVIKTRILRMITAARGNPPILVMLGTPHQKNYLWEAWNDPDFYKVRVTWEEAVKEGQMREEEVMFMKERLPENVFKVWYEAEFPEDDMDAVFKYYWIQEAYDKYNEYFGKEVKNYHYRIGVDPARFGTDLSVITVLKVDEDNDEYIVEYVESIKRSDLMYLVGRVVNIYEKYKDKVKSINVDEIGLGAGVVDRLKELRLPVSGFNAGANPPKDSHRYENAKAYWTMKLREVFENGKIVIPNEKQLIDELLKIRYEFSSSGKLRIKDPEDKSPDYFDSLLIAFAEGTITKYVVPEKGLDTSITARGGMYPWML